MKGMTEQALSGIKVLEYAELVAGPYCTKLMADLGAEVIKAERPGIGDAARKAGPFPDDIPHREKSGLFLYANTNKIGITLDTGTTKGREILCELIKQADVLVEDKPPGIAQKLGLGYEKLKEINPKLIVTSITTFGQSGLYKDYKAYHLNAFHAGGEGFMIPGGAEYIERPPLKSGKCIGDYDAGLNAAIFTLGALFKRNLSGLGQHVDISRQESIMALCRWEISRYASGGEVLSRATQGYPIFGVMPCKDGYVAIVAWTDREWPRVIELMGNPEWALKDRFKDIRGRHENREELNAHTLEWTMNHTKEEIYSRGQALGVAVGIVATAEDLANSLQLKERMFFIAFDHPEAGKVTCPSAPYKFSRTPWKLIRPAPLLGQHNEHVYCERLGYSKQDMVKLAQAGTI